MNIEFTSDRDDRRDDITVDSAMSSTGIFGLANVNGETCAVISLLDDAEQRWLTLPVNAERARLVATQLNAQAALLDAGYQVT